MDHLFGGGCIQVVQQFNLPGVNQGFAVETELFDQRRLLQETGFVIGIGINRVERLNASRPSRLQQ
ncbi:hypothetical protein D3C73_1044490 [compost metagenome]